MSDPKREDAIRLAAISKQEAGRNHLEDFPYLSDDCNVCWLISQAERLRILESARIRDDDYVYHLHQKLTDAEAALEFYASAKIGPIYDDETRTTFKIYEQYGPASIGDVGLKAKEALRKIRGE